jgi:hypothetical protein
MYRERRLGGTLRRRLMLAAIVTAGTLCSSIAMATITQGDFSVYGFFESREEGRWGEGSSSKDSTPTKLIPVTPTGTFASPGQSFGMTGGSYDFNHWDLVEMRQLADVRPDYHFIKNYKFLGRFDSLVVKDADFFAYYRPWYDAYGSIKNHGRQRPNTDVIPYQQNQQGAGTPSLQNEYFKNDLREYYSQINFTDNFSARIGKQQVIWTEADALSGTEVTNPANISFHGVYGAESAEDVRTNLRMFKLNYILPDYLGTANNEVEGFWIPGDFEGTIKATADPRNPWIPPIALGGGTPATAFPLNFNLDGQILNVNEAPNLDTRAMAFAPIGPKIHGKQTGKFFDVILKNLTRPPSDSIENSEFGFRYSSLLPIGNGLQSSFIYLYEFRDPRGEACVNCPPSVTGEPGAFGGAAPFPAGTFIIPGFFTHPVRPGVPVGGSLEVVGETDYRRNSFFGLTGTYYDKQLTDIVYRYDFLYQPDHAIGIPSTQDGGRGSEWTEQTRWIVAGDRPTYIPWISKQHTFLTAQYTATWLPDRPANAESSVIPGIPATGKARELSNLMLLAATDWLMNGQLTTVNAFVWDIDDDVGELSSTNVYRYSRNVLLGINAQWFVGRSGRYTDPFLLSREQRFNDLEFTLTYEI